jgi:hypothetical protein
VVKDYEIHNNHVVLILHDNTHVNVFPMQLTGGMIAYHKLLFLLHRMYTNETAAELVNNLALKLIN